MTRVDASLQQLEDDKATLTEGRQERSGGQAWD